MAEARHDGGGMTPQGSTPVPDPTVLTTQASERAVAALRELMEARVDALGVITDTKFSERDKAISILQELTNKIPGLISEGIAHLQMLHDEKFSSIQKQFAERDTRTEQAAATTSKAIDAALSAQKEASGEQNRSNEAKITKSEGAFTKQIDQISVLMSAESKASDVQMNDIKQRLIMIESHGKGTSDSWAMVFAVVGGLAGVATAVGAVITVMVR